MIAEMPKRMRWLAVGVLSLVAVGGCGQNAASVPEGDAAVSAVASGSATGTASTASSPAAAGPPWYSVAGEAPEISGAVHRTNSPFESQDWINDAARFHRAWLYTGRVRIVEVDINRADPTANRCDEMRETESKLRPLGHIVVPLQGVADGGIAIVDRVKKGADGPAVRTYACSGNAIVSVSMLVEGVIGGEADLTARSAELTAVLTEVLADLRPR